MESSGGTPSLQSSALPDIGVKSSMQTIPFLQEIYTTRHVFDADGKAYKLESEIDEAEGELIQSIIAEYRFKSSLEIGCAYGLSTLNICAALSKQESPRHTIIDPFQSTDWHGIGVNNLKRAGFDFFELIEQPSELALPSLLQAGRTFQFALIDGWHTFDHTLLDFFYINRMLEDGGVVIIDDVSMQSVRKVIRYILNYPNYRIVGSANAAQRPPSLRRRVSSAYVRSLGVIIPQRSMREVFAESCLKTDRALGLDCSMIALQKTGADTRPWNWYSPF